MSQSNYPPVDKFIPKQKEAQVKPLISFWIMEESGEILLHWSKTTEVFQIRETSLVGK